MVTWHTLQFSDCEFLIFNYGDEFYMKKIYIVNTFLLAGFLLIWLIEIISCFIYDSVLIFNNESFFIILTLFALFLSFLLFKKFKISYLSILYLLIASGFTLLILRDSILFYLPFYHNESFSIAKCIIIYYSLLTFVLAIISGVIAVVCHYTKN